MDAPKTLLKLMHDIESELIEFCNAEKSKELVSLIKKRGCGFSVKSQESKHLWIVYEDVYIALNRDYERNISFATSGAIDTSDLKRFKQEEKVLKRLFGDLKKLKL